MKKYFLLIVANIINLNLTLAWALAPFDMELRQQRYSINKINSVGNIQISQIQFSKIESFSNFKSKFSCEEWQQFVGGHEGKITPTTHIGESSNVEFTLFEFKKYKTEFLDKMKRQMGLLEQDELTLKTVVYIRGIEIEPVLMRGSLIKSASEEELKLFMASMEKIKRTLSDQLSIANITGSLELKFDSPLVHCDLMGGQIQFRIKVQFDFRQESTVQSPLNEEQIIGIANSLRSSPLAKENLNNFTDQELLILRARALQESLSQSGMTKVELDHRQYIKLWSYYFEFGPRFTPQEMDDRRAQYIVKKMEETNSQTHLQDIDWVNNEHRRN